MNDPQTAHDYQEREVKAVSSVLVELGQVLGAWRDKFVIVGGAVPWLLYPDATPRHIGTIDIDLDLDPEALGGGEYATLVEALTGKGYERDVDDLRPFQLRRWVSVDDGEPVGVLVDLLMPRGAKGDRNAEKLISGLRVQGADGGDIALLHNTLTPIDGVMPDGRANRVELQVATIPALLVMKGYALVGRDKKKDAYDIYYSVRHFTGGVVALAAECMPMLDNVVVRTGFENIAGKFRHREDFGPTTVRIFLEESSGLGEMTPEQVQMDAFMQVSAWLRAIELAVS